MNCKRIQAELALLAGQDLDETASETLQQHVAECCACAAHWESLQNSLAVLHEVNAASAEPVGTVWVRLQPRLARCQPPMEGTRFNGWVPALGVLTACVLIVVFSDPGPQPAERRTVIGVHAAGAPVFEAQGVPMSARRHLQQDPSADLQRWLHEERHQIGYPAALVPAMMDDPEEF